MDSKRKPKIPKYKSMSRENSVIYKSGWVYKFNLNVDNSLKNFQRIYVELYRDGILKFYENEICPNAEDTIFLPSECIAIKTGYQVLEDNSNARTLSNLPNGLSIQLLFSVSSINNKTWIFCADSENELKVWIHNLEECRRVLMKSHHLNPCAYYASNGNPFFLNQTIDRNSTSALSAGNMNNALNPMLLSHHLSANFYLPSAHQASSSITSFTPFAQQPTSTSTMYAPNGSLVTAAQLFTTPGMTNNHPALLSNSQMNNLYPSNQHPLASANGAQLARQAILPNSYYTHLFDGLHLR